METCSKAPSTIQGTMFSCSRANEFESGYEGDVICACPVDVNCALPTNCRMARNKISHAVQLSGTDEVLFWTVNRIIL